MLIAASVPLYTYDAYILLKGTFGKEPLSELLPKTDSTFSVSALIKNSMPVHFEKKGRNPFTPYTVSEQVKKSLVNANQNKTFVAKAPPKAPDIKINGIMWNPQNPVAMLSLPDGSSVVARSGQAFSGMTIKKIDKSFIVVLFENKTYTINK